MAKKQIVFSDEARQAIIRFISVGVLIVGGLLATSSAALADFQNYEKFTYDPNWDGLNNRTSPQNFGRSLTNHTGGGDFFEAGGTIVREDNPRAYYGADIGTLNLNSSLKMTGALNPHTPGGGTIFIGYFNSGNGGYPQNNTLGLYLDGNAGGTDVYIRVVSGTGIDHRTGPHTNLPVNTDLRYDLRYNPSANGGNGQITLSINGGAPFTSNLPAGLKTAGATFNRFGIHNVGVDGGPFDAYIDAVTYTSSIAKVERFTVDPSWEGHNNRINNPRTIVQNFGYSSGTNNAGGSPGEVGGQITPAGEPAYYAKIITPLKTFNDSLTASGKLKVTGSSNVLLGFFYAGTINEWRTQNSVALRLDGRGSDFKAYAEYGTDLWRADSTNEFTFNVNQVYNWSLTYDPNGNGGGGTVTGVIGGQTMTVNLAPGHKADEGNFNRFGLLNVVKSADDPGDVWIDDVTILGVTDNFDSNPNWDSSNAGANYSSNNVRFNFDFGHSPGTNFAGGAGAGEMGGFFFRGDSREASKMAFYGDDLADESFNFNTPLHAEGKVAFRRGVSDSTVHIGFFHSTESVRVSEAQGCSTPENFIGATIEGPSSEGFFFYPSYNSNVEGEGSCSNRGDITPPHIYPDNQVHNWTLDYDPNGSGGLGRVTVTLDGVQAYFTLNATHRAQGASFNRFGFITPHIDGNGQTVYFDDVIYTQANLP